MVNLSWEEAEPSAREALDIWNSGSELEWAQKSWSKLEEAGLTAYDNLRDYHLVAARFLSLCQFYRDWASFYDGRHDGPLYWISPAQGEELDRFYLGQLLPDEELEENYNTSIEMDALAILIERQREVIAPLLIESVGGAAELHRELRSTLRPVPEETVVKEPNPVEKEQQELNFEDEEDDEWEEDKEDDPFETTAENLEAYEWITSGCPWRF